MIAFVQRDRPSGSVPIFPSRGIYEAAYVLGQMACRLAPVQESARIRFNKRCRHKHMLLDAAHHDGEVDVSAHRFGLGDEGVAIH